MNYKYIFLFLVLLGSSELKAQDHTCNISFDYYPSSSYGQVVCHTYFCLSYAEESEQAEWVAYKLTNKNFNKNVKRKNSFKADPKVKTGSASLRDYKGSGYDRGHLAPAGSMKINSRSMLESFYMSNMSPQKPGFNRGIWKKIEEKVRYWSSFKDSTFVITGPILGKALDHIGPNKVEVPYAYYKCLLGYKDNKAVGLAFLIEHNSSDNNIYKFITSIDSIEKVSKIDFFKNMDTELQKEIESNNDIKKWVKNADN